MASFLDISFPDPWVPWIESGLVLVATYLVARAARGIFRRIFEKSPLPQRWGLRPGRLVELLVWIGGLLAVGALLGVNVSSLIIGLGAFSIAVSFAPSTLLNNIVAGLLLHADESVRIGETIDLGTWQGRVVRISARTTELETKEGFRVIVPNAYLAQNPFRNLGREKKAG